LFHQKVLSYLPLITDVMPSRSHAGATTIKLRDKMLYNNIF